MSGVTRDEFLGVLHNIRTLPVPSPKLPPTTIPFTVYSVMVMLRATCFGQVIAAHEMFDVPGIDPLPRDEVYARGEGMLAANWKTDAYGPLTDWEIVSRSYLIRTFSAG